MYPTFCTFVWARYVSRKCIYAHFCGIVHFKAQNRLTRHHFFRPNQKVELLFKKLDFCLCAHLFFGLNPKVVRARKKGVRKGKKTTLARFSRFLAQFLSHFSAKKREK